MKKVKIYLLAVMVVLALSALSYAARKGYSPAVRPLSRQKQMELALSAAPYAISRHATIMLPGEDGKSVTVKKGTNGFTCMPDIDGQEVPSPMCADEAAMRFFLDMWSGKERPSNKTAGVAYMAQGGWHWEKDGKVIMSREGDRRGVKRVREPAHWMLIYPFSAAKSFLPNRPSTFGAWIMLDDTPYAHLMIYQDPMELTGEDGSEGQGE